jgi:hypothetical protein
MSTFIFGDSFIGPFTLIDDTNLKIYKFKGATMKGITKEDNENRKKIIDVLNNSNNIKCILFNFGHVDLYFSYYYDKFVKNKGFMIDPIAKKYIEFIDSINCNNCNKIVLAIYPSVLKDKHVFDSLISYGILSNEHVNSISDSDKKKVSNYKFRYNMYIKFNNLLKKYCKIYKINFIDLKDSLLNKDNIVKSKFINPVSTHGIHLLWEPLIPILLSKLKICNIKKIYKKDLEDSFSKYIKNKKEQIKQKLDSSYPKDKSI